MNKKQEFGVFIAALAIVGVILSACLYVIVEKIECFEDPCQQCMKAGYLCTNPYMGVDTSRIDFAEVENEQT